MFKSYEYLLARAWGADDWRAVARSGIGASLAAAPPGHSAALFFLSTFGTENR